MICRKSDENLMKFPFNIKFCHQHVNLAVIQIERRTKEHSNVDDLCGIQPRSLYIPATGLPPFQQGWSKSTLHVGLRYQSHPSYDLWRIKHGGQKIVPGCVIKWLLNSDKQMYKDKDTRSSMVFACSLLKEEPSQAACILNQIKIGFLTIQSANINSMANKVKKY